MKNILLIALAAFVFLGCTKKLETDVKPYVTLHQNEKQNLTIDFVGVTDERTTKIVSTILQDDEVAEEYPLNVEAKMWYTEALKRELNNAEMLSIDNTSNISVSINIKNISATYKKYSLDTKNMKANVKIELVIKKGDVVVTSQIEANQTVYKPMILDAAGFESIVNESMRDSVSKTVSILIKKLKEN